MNAEILERLVWAVLIVAAGVAAYATASRLSLGRARQQAVQMMPITTGSRVPRIVYFTTPTCVPCKTVQRPALRAVKEQLGDQVEVIEIDASSQPEVANQWGVLSVPTTFILDAQGEPRFVNHGVTRREKLLEQITRIE